VKIQLDGSRFVVEVVCLGCLSVHKSELIHTVVHSALDKPESDVQDQASSYSINPMVMLLRPARLR